MSHSDTWERFLFLSFTALSSRGCMHSRAASFPPSLRGQSLSRSIGARALVRACERTSSICLVSSLMTTRVMKGGVSKSPW